MLTINRPFYEYRDIYLFIAVGLAAFVTTFLVLGVITTINTNQLSNTARGGESAVVTDSKTSSEAASQSTGSDKRSGQEGTTSQSHGGMGALTQPSSTSQQTPLQSPTISAPVAVTSSGNPSGTTPQQPPAVIVQQPAPTVPAPVPTTSNPQQGGGDDNLIDLQLPLGIGLRLL